MPAQIIYRLLFTLTILNSLLLLPLITSAQPGSMEVLYSKTFSVRGASAENIASYSKIYTDNNRSRFFSVFSYGKDTLDKLIDTSGYGFYQVKGDTVIAHCIWIFLGTKRSNCDVLRGDVVFVAGKNLAQVSLQNLRYEEYGYYGNALRLEKSGRYKGLNICKHCSVAGIKLGEIADRNFAGIVVSYHDFLKRIK